MPETNNNGNNELHNRISAIKILLEAFRLERMLYIVVLCVSIITILTVAIIILVESKGAKYEWFIGLFVPAGAISYSVAQILKMWNQAIKFVMGQKIDEKDGE